MDVAAQVVEFWRNAGPQQWFARDDAFDARFREAFWTNTSPPPGVRASIGWKRPMERWR